MPQLNISQSIAAAAVSNIIAGWQYEYLPWPARIKLLVRAPVATLKLTVFSGSETIQEESPVQSGGTAGVTPSELNTPAVSFQAAGGDRLKLVIDEVSGLTPTVDGVIIVNPLF